MPYRKQAAAAKAQAKRDAEDWGASPTANGGIAYDEQDIMMGNSANLARIASFQVSTEVILQHRKLGKIICERHVRIWIQFLHPRVAGHLPK